MRRHWHDAHQWSLAEGRAGGGGPAKRRAIARRQAEALAPVHCQRFFRANKHSRYFEVLSHDAERQEGQVAPSQSLESMVLEELGMLEDRQQQGRQIVSGTASPKQVSPWLELTRWVSYLEGYKLSHVAALAALPSPESEPVLAAICRSVERIVEQAYHSVCNDRINVFDQMRINSFLQRPRAADRPLIVKLQKPTYRAYTNVMKRLLAFTYRSTRPQAQIRLRHRLTSRQIICLNDVVLHVEELLQWKTTAGSQGLELPAVREASSLVDRRCLGLCISLLDHELKGDLFESVVVGFFAALAIDEDKGILREAYHYTPLLSGFIKIAQMLVIQHAVVGAEDGKAEHPADLLDEMRERFMVHGARSPFSWASRLRVYGKKVRDSTTCLGYITWSDDEKCVSYKDVCDLSMDCFRGFVRAQVAAAQAQLGDLLLLHPDERREDLGVEFYMHRVADNAVENRDGWSFLQHPRNRDGTLPPRDNWLLQRVLTQEWLQDEFLSISSAKKPAWKVDAVCVYDSKVEAFLERMLLLVHLTAGQPARGTEILSLRHINTLHGHHRSIFVENGMVSLVTSYHKGYAVTGSTKIIHRYLPKEVGELLVYYLWLVLPFRKKLNLLALHKRHQPSPFLWGKPNGSDTWDSSRLSRILKREFRTALGQTVGILTYRHLAIAISRKHLQCGGFKRDYGLEDTKSDKQSSHSSWTAGTIYARGIEEAAGHVEERKAEYRKISKEWH